ncbi:hypothetical protein IHE45_03G031000 [Dioscorea alata]|uniref:Uncharacterized protein n=1 Tax=Dioscorea alata TaxID=55571 RepID=A0ACB7WJJ6_DIOAL|nr:hypothetical protein IHE45_03G031000 [Dioscorea alata]
MLLFIKDSSDLDFSGGKTNIVCFRFDGYASEPKWIVKFEMTVTGGFPRGAYAQLAVVQTEVIEKPWDSDYPNFHHTWTGGSTQVYGDLVEENFDRTNFKVGRLILDNKSAISGEKATITWKFDMTSGYDYSLVILGGKFTGTVRKGKVQVIGTTS